MFWIEAIAWLIVAISITYVIALSWDDVRLILTKKAILGIYQGTNGHQHARITRFAFWANKKGISHLFFLE